MKVHLKYRIPDDERSKIKGWLYLAQRRTQCWHHITDNMLVTENINNVTCKNCLKSRLRVDSR